MSGLYSQGVYSILRTIKLLINLELDLTNIEKKAESLRKNGTIRGDGLSQFFGLRQGKDTTYIS